MKKLAVLILFLLLLSGCGQDLPETEPTAMPTVPETLSIPTECTEPAQLLQFSYAFPKDRSLEDACLVTAPLSQILDGDVFRKITYYGPCDVALIQEGQEIPLENALYEEISVNQLLYEARLDAENGFCTVSRDSQNGLSRFYFDYTDFGLWICDDVYETPDGKKWTMEEVQFFAGNGLQQVQYGYSGYADRSTGTWIDHEDWGLEFSLSNITRKGATLTIQQSGGQQNGPLRLYGCNIRPVDDSSQPIWSENPYLFLKENGATAYHLDFSTLRQNYDPKQAYELQLWILDDQNLEAARNDPMVNDFTMEHWYTLPIPMGFDY